MTRAIGVLVVNGRLLLHQGPGERVWSLPGGRPQLLEPAPAAVARELREELGVDVAVGQLRFVVESLLTLRGQLYHEVGFYFAVTPPPGWLALHLDGLFPGAEPEKGLVFQWFACEHLTQVPVVPHALVAHLTGDKEDVQYLFSDDRQA